MTKQDLLNRISQMIDELKAEGSWFNSLVIDFYADGDLIYSGSIKITIEE